MKHFAHKIIMALILLLPTNLSANERFIIVDSWLCGFFTGGLKKEAKNHRFKSAFTEANQRAKNDLRIWGGLFHSDSNSNSLHRFGELSSRFTYQIPQTVIGFAFSQFMNTYTSKVNWVKYGCGSTVLNLDVDWPGLTLGNYIYGNETINVSPNNKLFQHEYGHYLQSKRMGLAYYVRVGIPAILSKGDHDQHPVELDCTVRAFHYFNTQIPNFKNDLFLSDSLGWDYYYNPFPDKFGTTVYYPKGKVTYVEYKGVISDCILSDLIVRPTFIDYSSWLILPLPVFVGMVHSKHYNKSQIPAKHTYLPKNGIPLN